MRGITWVGAPSPQGARDVLTEILRQGAQQSLTQAVEAELETLLRAHSHRRLETGQQRVVRHGHGLEREILSGIGPMKVRRPKARGPRGDGGGPDQVHLGDPASVCAEDEVAGRGAADAVSAGRLDGRLQGGAVGAGRSGDVGAGSRSHRATEGGVGEGSRSLAEAGSLDPEVYVWADGIYLRCRMEEDRQCVLVLPVATASGRKELLGFQTGFRESGQSWRELLEDLELWPKVGDGGGGGVSWE